MWHSTKESERISYDHKADGPVDMAALLCFGRDRLRKPSDTHFAGKGVVRC